MNQKCCINGCRKYGEPEEGFDFFACPSCLEKLERELKIEWVKKYLAYSNN